MKNRFANNFWPLVVIALGILMLFIITTSCRTKKDVVKTKEETEVRATESTTTTTIESGTLVTQADSTESEFLVLDKPVTVVTNLPGIVTTTTFDPKTKSVKTKTVQKPQEVPFTKTTTAVSNRTVEAKHSHESKSKHKETDFNYWSLLWLLPIVLLIAVFIRILRA